MSLKSTVERLSKDPFLQRQCIEALIGQSAGSTSSSGFTSYTCPFSGCEGSSKHFGICYEPNSRFYLGLWKCFKCAQTGVGFINLARALGRDPRDILESLEVGGPEPVAAPKAVVNQNITLPEFGTVWSWIRKNSGSLDAKHKELLISRSLDLDKLPPWYSVPGVAILHKASAFFGEPMVERASVLKHKGDIVTPAWFAQAGRLALVYPERPWESNGKAEFLSTYKSGAKTGKLLRPTGVSTEGILYFRPESSSDISTMVISEGELKTEASNHAGVGTLGLLGVTNSHREAVKAIKYLLEKSNNTYPKKVLIVFDRDNKESSAVPVQRAAKRLLEVLSANLKGLPIAIRELPKSEDKVDIDSWISDMAFKQKRGITRARESYRKFITED